MGNEMLAILDAEIANQSQVTSFYRLRQKFISDKVSFIAKLNFFADIKLTSGAYCSSFVTSPPVLPLLKSIDNHQGFSLSRKLLFRLYNV